MAKSIVLNRFRDVGLTAYEAKTYLPLLEKDTLTVAEVARIAKIPRTNAYEALEKLTAKGLCKEKPGQLKNTVPLWPPLPEEAPDNWPNCDTRVINSKVIPTGLVK